MSRIQSVQMFPQDAMPKKLLETNDFQFKLNQVYSQLATLNQSQNINNNSSNINDNSRLPSNSLAREAHNKSLGNFGNNGSNRTIGLEMLPGRVQSMTAQQGREHPKFLHHRNELFSSYDFSVKSFSLLCDRAYMKHSSAFESQKFGNRRVQSKGVKLDPIEGQNTHQLDLNRHGKILSSAKKQVDNSIKALLKQQDERSIIRKIVVYKGRKVVITFKSFEGFISDLVRKEKLKDIALADQRIVKGISEEVESNVANELKNGIELEKNRGKKNEQEEHISADKINKKSKVFDETQEVFLEGEEGEDEEENVSQEQKEGREMDQEEGQEDQNENQDRQIVEKLCLQDDGEGGSAQNVEDIEKENDEKEIANQLQNEGNEEANEGKEENIRNEKQETMIIQGAQQSDEAQNLDLTENQQQLQKQQKSTQGLSEEGESEGSTSGHVKKMSMLNYFEENANDSSTRFRKKRIATAMINFTQLEELIKLEVPELQRIFEATKLVETQNSQIPPKIQFNFEHQLPQQSLSSLPDVLPSRITVAFPSYYADQSSSQVVCSSTEDRVLLLQILFPSVELYINNINYRRQIQLSRSEIAELISSSFNSLPKFANQIDMKEVEKLEIQAYGSVIPLNFDNSPMSFKHLSSAKNTPFSMKSRSSRFPTQVSFDQYWGTPSRDMNIRSFQTHQLDRRSLHFSILKGRHPSTFEEILAQKYYREQPSQDDQIIISFFPSKVSLKEIDGSEDGLNLIHNLNFQEFYDLAVVSEQYDIINYLSSKLKIPAHAWQKSEKKTKRKIEIDLGLPKADKDKLELYQVSSDNEDNGLFRELQATITQEGHQIALKVIPGQFEVNYSLENRRETIPLTAQKLNEIFKNKYNFTIHILS